MASALAVAASALRRSIEREGFTVRELPTDMSPEACSATRDRGRGPSLAIWAPTLQELSLRVSAALATERRAPRVRGESLDFGFTGPGVSP